LLYTLYQNHRTSIVKVNTDRSVQKRLATYPGLNAGAEFSNNGKKVALCLSRDGEVELYTTDPDGTNPLRLTKDRSVESSPSWSPDDRLICFVSDRNGRPNLYVIPSDGGTPRRLIKRSVEEVSPDWSSVSNLLSFAIRRSGGYQIAIMDMNKPSHERKITVLTESGNWQSPSWAPDGRHLICSRQVGQKYELCMIDVRTGKIVKLTKPADIALPNWSTLLSR
jgi:TolB protein